MPPCFDVYVLVRPEDRASTLSRFVDTYVDQANPGDPGFAAFRRTFVADEPLPGDAEELADLRRDPEADTAFSLYLRGTKGLHEAIVTLTEEGDVVLGLGLDDPLNDPSIEHRARELLGRLLEDFGGRAGIGGTELPPPQSLAEWADRGLVTVRVGRV